MGHEASTMYYLSLRILVGYAAVYFISPVSAHSTKTTTTTTTSTTTVLSSTTIHTFHNHGKGTFTFQKTEATEDSNPSTPVNILAESQSTPSSDPTTASSSSPSSFSTPSIDIGPSGSYQGYLLRESVINSTNVYRAQHLAKPVFWNHTLASYAQDYVAKCLWQHSGGPYGENLAAGFGTPTLAVEAWGDEEPEYNYEKREFSEKSGHFTQLVWKTTSSVGCAAALCENHNPGGTVGWYLVCEYWPPGNVLGDFGENVGKPGEGKDGLPGFGSVAAGRVGGERAVGRTAAVLVMLVYLVGGVVLV